MFNEQENERQIARALVEQAQWAAMADILANLTASQMRIEALLIEVALSLGIRPDAPRR